jgi:hypothetical protein
MPQWSLGGVLLLTHFINFTRCFGLSGSFLGVHIRFPRPMKWKLGLLGWDDEFEISRGKMRNRNGENCRLSNKYRSAQQSLIKIVSFTFT